METDFIKPDIIIWTKEDALLEDISSILGENGFKVFNVSDKHEMFDLLEDNQSSIVILDCELPQIFGFEVYEVIKKIDRFKDTRIILLSSIPQSISGVDECIEKGRVRDLLLLKIVDIVQREFAVCEDVEWKDEEYIENGMVSDSEMPEHEEAKKFARIIVSDIVLYNKDKAVKGLQDDTFYELLKDEIEEGRNFYSQRISAGILKTTNYFDDAINKVIRSKVMV